MGKDLFAYLPPEIIADIFSRLPVRTIVSCKCVCKSWLDLIKTTEFVNSHVSKSVPVIIMSEWFSCPEEHKIVEFVEELDLNYRLNLAFNLEIPFHGGVHSSVNGIVFCCQLYWRDPNYLLICNPVTREYIKLRPPKMSGYRPLDAIDTYGFGVSRISGQYKLVRLFFEIKVRKPVEERFKQVRCKVYTIGTGSWRKIASPKVFHHEMNAVGAFLNGNLHWLIRDWNVKGCSPRVLCLDLETEVFSSFSTPIDHCDKHAVVSALGDYLYFSHLECDSWGNHNAHFWLMEEYGNEKSWTKLFNFSRNNNPNFYGCHPIKVFGDGDIMIEMERLFYYSSKTGTVQLVDACGLYKGLCRAVVYTPSFVSLKSFAVEKVRTF